MVKVKDINAAKKNFEDAASLVPERYKQGVSSADWKEAAMSDAAESLYAQKLQEAIQKKKRQKGIAKVSNEEWRSNAVNKGAAKIGTAMRLASNKWATAIAPYFEALRNLSLPEKTADPMANIDNRLKRVVEALVNKKKELEE